MKRVTASCIQYRNECNEFLDNISIISRRLDCGVNLSDIGFLSYE